jgi:enamine deaminase RidA (YjgF/YER057c/UK114 family)
MLPTHGRVDLPRRQGELAPRASRAGEFVFTGAITPHRPATGLLASSFAELPDEAAGLRPTLLYTRILTERVIVQCWQVIENLRDALSNAGSGLDRLVHLRVFLRRVSDGPTVVGVLGALLGSPAASGEMVEASGPGLDPDLDIWMDAVALTTDSSLALSVVGGTGLEPLCRPFAPATRAGPLVFTSTMAPVDLRSNRIVSHRRELEAEDQAFLAPLGELCDLSERYVAQQALVWRHLRGALAAAGATLTDVVHHMAWLRLSMRDLGNGTITRMLDPAMRDYCLTCFPVSGLRREGSLFEGRFVAVIGSGEAGDQKEVRGELNGLSRSYRGVVAAGPLLFSAGEVPIDLERGLLVDQADRLPEGRRLLQSGRIDGPGRMLAKATDIYGRLAAGLAEFGGGLHGVVHQSIYLNDLGLLPSVERAALEAFDTRGMPPTTVVPILEASPFQSAGLEIEVTALRYGSL